MNSAYSVAVYCYYSAIHIASLFNKKARLWVTGRKKWECVIFDKINPGESWIWFHCASLGEFEDCCETFFQIQKENLSKKTILTVFSPSAFEALKHSGLFDIITYLPIDTKFNAKRYLDIVKPDLVLFSRSELWLYFLLEVKSRKIPLFLISLRLNFKSNFLKWPLCLIYRRCFGAFNIIFCQNTETQQLLYSNFNITDSLVTGNTRFSRVYNQSKTQTTFNDIKKFVLDNIVIVMGSSLRKDERIFLKIYDELKFLGIKWIIVPHEIDESLIAKKIKSKNIILHSNINELNNYHDILVIDSVGSLKHIYRFADLALIGGGFDKIGIHNIIEPAVYGVETAFGPNHRNYEEAIQLMHAGMASVYKNSTELGKLIKSKLSKPADENLKESVRQYVKNNALNNLKITDSILAHLKLLNLEN